MGPLVDPVDVRVVAVIEELHARVDEALQRGAGLCHVLVLEDTQTRGMSGQGAAQHGTPQHSVQGITILSRHYSMLISASIER